MPAKQPCDRFTPHLFLSNNRCRDCDHLEADHVSVESNGRGRAPTIEEKVEGLVKANCSHYTPHAWIVDRCRDCGRPEAVHETSSGSVVEDDSTKKERTINTGRFRKEQDIAAALGVNSGTSRRGSGNAATNHAATSSANPLQIRGKTANGLRTAHRVMDNAVAQMVLMDQELEEAKQQEAESLQSNTISQEQYDAKMAEINAAFALKEAQLKAEVEQAKKQIAEAELLLKAEQQTESQRRDSITQQHSEELQRIRQEAEQARAEAAAFRAQAEAFAAQQGKAEQEREQAEKQIQAEIEAARLEAQAARQEAEELKAAVAAQKEQQEQQRREQQEREEQLRQQQQQQAAALTAAQAVNTAAAEAAAAVATAAAFAAPKPVEEEKEQTLAPSSSSVVIPPPVPVVLQPTTDANPPASSASVDDDDEAQPTAAAPASSEHGPYAGTVNLNDVLLKVEKLFLSGKNYFRFCYTKPSVVISSVFLRVINDEYVLCWSKGNSRSVHQSRTLPFSAIRAIVIGTQSSIFQRSEFKEAPSVQCFSILGNQHSLHLMASNERDAEMTAFGLASLMKESRLSVNVFDFGQYKENDDAVLIQTTQEHSEEDDGSMAADLSDYDILNNTQSTPRYLLQLAVKCNNLALTHQNTIVCLVDREEKTDRLVYVSQTEKVSKTANPEFSKYFEIEWEKGVLPPRQLRFNVYDVSAKSTQIEDADRIGSVRIELNELVELDGIEFLYLLTHKDHAKNHKLLTQRSTISIKCVKKQLMKRNSIVNGSALNANDKNVLSQLQNTLIHGDIFTSYAEHQPSYPLTLFYRIQPNAEYKTQQAAEANFVLGNLYYTIHNSDDTDNSSKKKNATKEVIAAKTEVLPLRTICDVYVGKKHRSFGANAKDECCLSLLSKNGVRLDLEAKNKQQRDEFVNAITSLLKNAANEAKKKAQAKLGVKN